MEGDPKNKFNLLSTLGLGITFQIFQPFKRSLYALWQLNFLFKLWIPVKFLCFFQLFLLELDFCQFCMVIRFFHPRHNGQWPPTSNDFLSQILSITFIIPILIFPFECLVLNKGTTGTIFISSLVWRGPWLGIEPGTSRTRSQHSTTRLSRRRSSSFEFHCFKLWILLL